MKKLWKTKKYSWWLDISVWWKSCRFGFWYNSWVGRKEIVLYFLFWKIYFVKRKNIEFHIKPEQTRFVDKLDRKFLSSGKDSSYEEDKGLLFNYLDHLKYTLNDLIDAFNKLQVEVCPEWKKLFEKPTKEKEAQNEI